MTTETIAPKELFRSQIENTRIGVVGMGYVGLPLALAFAQKDFQVVGLTAMTQKSRNSTAANHTSVRAMSGLGFLPPSSAQRANQ